MVVVEVMEREAVLVKVAEREAELEAEGVCDRDHDDVDDLVPVNDDVDVEVFE